MIPALIVPVLNRPDLLDRMLRSIDHDIEHLLVIDNGGVAADVVAQATYSAPHIKNTHYVRSPFNLGVPASWNLGVKMLPHAHYWLIVNSDAWFPPGALLRIDAAAERDAVVLQRIAPEWACFTLGDGAVRKVGLFDEGLYPAYFEDNDMHRRCTYWGVPVKQSGVSVNHDNSSTINSEPRYRAHNDRTFRENAAYYQAKAHRGDMSAGEWNLTTRRRLSWDD